MKRAVFFAYVWPESFSSAAGVRTLELAECLNKIDYQVTFLSPCKENEASDQVRKSGFSTRSCELNNRESLDFLKSLAPDLIIFDRFITEEQFGWQVRSLCPSATLIIDTQDLHCLRRARESHLKTISDLAFVPSSVQPSGEDRARELASFYRADGVLVVSRFEEKLLYSLGFENERIYYCPFSPSRQASSQGPSFLERKGFVFLGNLRHPPNLDSLRWIRKYLWPLLRTKIKGATFTIIGAYPPKEVSSWHGKDGITLMGNHPNPYEVLNQSRVMLAPLRFGAGIKGKILDAWNNGLPVVASPMALEGMSDLIPSFSTPEEFCQISFSLHEEESKWKEWQDLAKIEVKKFSDENIQKLFLTSVEKIHSCKEKNRAHPVAEILRLSQMQSTKYFSLWIEEKNKIAKKGEQNSPLFD